MGLPLMVSRKPLASSMKPTAFSAKPDASLGHQGKPVSSQPGHGVITRRELESMKRELDRKLGEKRGAVFTAALQEEADTHGGGLKARHFGEVVDELERNHKDGIRPSDIDKLKSIADASL